VRARILGSAAGGGIPQWNCRCPTCEAARAGNDARPGRSRRSRSAGAKAQWFLVNASPDLRQQLAALTGRARDGVRARPVAAVLLTDARSTTRRAAAAARVRRRDPRLRRATKVRRALSDGYQCCGSSAATAASSGGRSSPAARVALEGSSLAVESFAAGGDAPRYLAGREAEADVEASGLTFRDRDGGGVLTYVPGLARLDDDVLERLGASDVVLVDGTFWRDDELARLGISDRSARQMGHVPLSGAGGTLEALARLERPRAILVHINNTNPVLLERSPERDAVVRAGVEVAHDGLEVEL
jgi:pyrroloquinoline quinone biosynthesis protein B